MIQLTHGDLMPEVDSLRGQFLDASHYDRVVRDTATVLKPDGSVLLVYAKDVLPRSLCELAFRAFKDVRLSSDNRGLAAGARRFQRVGSDGKRSRTSRTRSVPSEAMGFLDRNTRSPHCRMTNFTLRHLAEFKVARALARDADHLYRALAPERWAVQRAFVEGVSKDFVVPGTVFTTITVNRNFRTAAHQDPGNFCRGLGVMAVLAGGRYDGAELIFPRYRTAVDARTGGLLLADNCELHGNAPFSGREFVRLSFVFYARTGMRNCCRTVEEERERAKRLP